MSLLKSTHLRPAETIVKIVHPYYLTYFWSYLLAAVLIVLPFFFMFLLFSWGRWGVGGFIAILLVGLYILSRAVFLRYYNALVVTSERLIKITQSGAWDRQVSELNYKHVRQVSFQVKGILRTIFKFGLLRVETDGGSEPLLIDRLPKPAQIQETIITWRDLYQSNRTGQSGGQAG